MSRYWFIAAGLIILALTALALIRSQMNLSTGNQTAAPTITGGQNYAVFASPTTAVAPSISEGMSVTIMTPANGTIVTSTQLLVRGKTKAGAEVFINEKELIADSQGNFSTTLTLDEGENLIIVTVNDDEGNVAEQELVVTYNSE